MHLSARQGVISLLEKPAKEMIRIKNWRPLTLLNTDNKIYTKLLARQLQNVLWTIIHASQTGFRKNRQMSENIIKIMEVIETCEINCEDLILISFDFEKAFDMVEWNAMFTAFECFGFGEKYLEMIKVIFNDPIIYASNNGFWGDPIFPSRGARQGCCFSPLGFIVLVELLGIGIRQNKSIKGVYLGDTHVVSGQFADDLWATLQPNAENVNNLINKIESFGSFSGSATQLRKKRLY